MKPITYNVSTILDLDNEKIEVARHPKMVVKLPLNIDLPKYAMMRLKVFDKNSDL